MTLTSRSTKVAYLLHGALSLLVIGVLGWATAATLRLERVESAERQAVALRERDNAIRLAMYRMETWANARLAGAFQLSSADYSPLYYPSPDEVRVRTGETLPAGFIVRLSPLLLHPTEDEAILLHFQASPRGGYRSPQLVPEEARGWPNFAPAEEFAAREKYQTTLAALAYSFTVDELTRKYEEAGGQPPESAGPGGDLEAATAREVAERSEYTRRRLNTTLAQRAQTPPVECLPQQLAIGNILAPGVLDVEPEFASDVATNEELVGVTHQTMRPVWLKLANRPTEDLAFLRAVYADGDTALQGFIVDWPRFRGGLLSVARDLFPRATIDVIDPPLSGNDDQNETVFSLIPARLSPNDPAPAIADAGWSTTRTVLLVGWAASLVMLVALGVGIGSLISLSERRSQFAYAVTHELRTPLTTFRLYTDMLAQGLVREGDRQLYLETLNNESRRLADLVSSVLEYSRIENKSVPVNLGEVSAGEVLEAVREACAQRCQSAGVTLRIAAGDSGDTRIETDRQHVVQIIGNLVDNACKYGRNGADSVVTVSASRDDGWCRFDVADEGPGVPARLRSVIFKPYRRGDTESTPATGGIGLGLALSRSWAKQLGGQLELVPPPKGVRGARFRFSLPIRG